MWEILSAIACAILMFLALVGTIFPILPGIPLAWLGLLIYAAGTGFHNISVITIIVFFVVTVATMAIGYFAPMLGAKKNKASRAGIIGAFIGLMIGFFVLGFWGILLGPFVGALIGELMAKKPWGQSIKSALGTFIGYLAGTLLQLVVILIMAGFFLAALF